MTGLLRWQAILEAQEDELTQDKKTVFQPHYGYRLTTYRWVLIELHIMIRLMCLIKIATREKNSNCG